MTDTRSKADEHEHDEAKDVVIVVNGEPKQVTSKEVSYEEVVKLAFPTPPFADTLYTVTFRNAKKPKEGSLGEGQSVEVKKDGTIFNVKATDKS